jgi:hypothetical protein
VIVREILAVFAFPKCCVVSPEYDVVTQPKLFDSYSSDDACDFIIPGNCTIRVPEADGARMKVRTKELSLKVLEGSYSCKAVPYSIRVLRLLARFRIHFGSSELYGRDTGPDYDARFVCLH